MRYLLDMRSYMRDASFTLSSLVAVSLCGYLFYGYSIVNWKGIIKIFNAKKVVFAFFQGRVLYMIVQ